MQLTCTVVLLVIAVEARAVAAVAGNVSAAALIVHDAVMVICTAKFAVALAAGAAVDANSDAARMATSLAVLFATRNMVRKAVNAGAKLRTLEGNDFSLNRLRLWVF